MTDHRQTETPISRFTSRVGETEIEFGADKEKHGLVSLRRPEAVFDLVREPYFALNLYRIMCDRGLQAIARTEPFLLASRRQREMKLQWEATEANPCRIEAMYTLVDAATIDLTISIEAVRTASDYEITVSSYFDFALEPYAIIRKRGGVAGPEEMLLHKLEEHPLIKGHYVYLPRDNAAGRTRMDGRWLNRKNGLPIASFVTGPCYGKAVAIMGTKELHVVQMADPKACVAIGMTYASPDEHDGIRQHNALYFTLFGGDLGPGDKRTARMRQVVQTGVVELDSVLALYGEFTG